MDPMPLQAALKEPERPKSPSGLVLPEYLQFGEVGWRMSAGHG